MSTLWQWITTILGGDLFNLFWFVTHYLGFMDTKKDVCTMYLNVLESLGKSSVKAKAKRYSKACLKIRQRGGLSGRIKSH
jgi:hypothetical protein